MKTKEKTKQEVPSKEEKRNQGKKNRRNGAMFELKVRKDLEAKGWIVDKWTNNVEFPEENINKPPEERIGKLIKAKSNRFNMRSCGFPDFVCFMDWGSFYKVEAVEVKTNGYLDKVEKQKCRWYLDNKIFSKIYIASKKDGEIEFKEFK